MTREWTDDPVSGTGRADLRPGKLRFCCNMPPRVAAQHPLSARRGKRPGDDVTSQGLTVRTPKRDRNGRSPWIIPARAGLPGLLLRAQYLGD
jgi:hypothetical protein